MLVYAGLKITVSNLAEDDSLTWRDLLVSDSSTPNVSLGPRAVLFTTFKNQPDRMFQQYNTIRNWASLRPFVQPVLFTTSRQGDGTDLLEQTARDHGWHMYPAPGVNDKGLPFVRPMYEMVERLYADVTFRGYSNGDLLYDESLERTLAAVSQYIDPLNHTVLFGNHTICAGNLVNERKVHDSGFLREWAAVNSTVNRNGSKAYVILNGPFPWKNFPGLVVGRRGFDNFLVNVAKAHGATAIDVTKSLLAVHQPSTGIAASDFATDPHFNANVIANVSGLVNMTNATSARYETHRDFLGNVYLLDRWEKKPAEENFIKLKKPATKAPKKDAAEKKINIPPTKRKTLKRSQIIK